MYLTRLFLLVFLSTSMLACFPERAPVGSTEGSAEGSGEGNSEGSAEGNSEGATTGTQDSGNTDGTSTGNSDGSQDSGSTDGATTGSGDDWQDAGSADGSSTGNVDDTQDAGSTDGTSSISIDAGVVAEYDAEALCILALTGGINYARYMTWSITNSFGRCSAEDSYDFENPPPASGLNNEPVNEAYIASRCEPGETEYERWAKMLAIGNITVDSQAIANCRAARTAYREAIATGNPEDLEGAFSEPICVNMITGSAPLNTVCLADLECAEGLNCEYVEADNKFYCLAPAAAGEACRPDAVAGFGRSCASDSKCINNLCVALPGANESCAETNDCTAGLTCDNSNLCVTPAGANESCATRACGDGLYCNDTDTCVPNLQVGDDCTPNVSECEGACIVCRPETPNGAFKCLDRGQTGDGCNSLQHCRNGFYCDENACVATKEEGGTCTSTTQCAENLRCDGTVCVPVTDCAALDNCGIGESCNSNTDCTYGLICDEEAEESVCVTVPARGESCAGEGQVCGGDDYCKNGNCVKKEANAGDCTDDSQCQSDRCQDSKCAPMPSSCTHAKDSFAQIVLFSFILPYWRKRKRRQET